MKETLIRAIDEEIEYAKKTGMPQFVAGLSQAKEVIKQEYRNKEER